MHTPRNWRQRQTKQGHSRCLSIHWWMKNNQQNAVHLMMEAFICRKEWSADTSCNMNETQNYAEVERSQTQESIYYTIPFIVNSRFPTQNRQMDGDDMQVSDSRLRRREWSNYQCTGVVFGAVKCSGTRWSQWPKNKSTVTDASGMYIPPKWSMTDLWLLIFCNNQNYL